MYAILHNKTQNIRRKKNFHLRFLKNQRSDARRITINAAIEKRKKRRDQRMKKNARKDLCKHRNDQNKLRKDLNKRRNNKSKRRKDLNKRWNHEVKRRKDLNQRRKYEVKRRKDLNKRRRHSVKRRKVLEKCHVLPSPVNKNIGFL